MATIISLGTHCTLISTTACCAIIKIERIFSAARTTTLLESTGQVLPLHCGPKCLFPANNPWSGTDWESEGAAKKGSRLLRRKSAKKWPTVLQTGFRFVSLVFFGAPEEQHYYTTWLKRTTMFNSNNLDLTAQQLHQLYLCSLLLGRKKWEINGIFWRESVTTE